MTTWEYRVVRLNEYKPSEHEKSLNSFGAEGWELVALVGVYAYMKRPAEGTARAVRR